MVDGHFFNNLFVPDNLLHKFTLLRFCLEQLWVSGLATKLLNQIVFQDVFGVKTEPFPRKLLTCLTFSLLEPQGALPLWAWEAVSDQFSR